MAAQEGSWLISFNYNPVDRKNRKWFVAIDSTTPRLSSEFRLDATASERNLSVGI